MFKLRTVRFRDFVSQGNKKWGINGRCLPTQDIYISGQGDLKLGVIFHFSYLRLKSEIK